MESITKNLQDDHNEYLNKLKNKKNPKFFNKEEIKEKKKIKKQKEDYNEKRLKRFLFNYKDYKLPPLNSLSQKNLLDNNSILIRPHILSSAKQIQYEKEKIDLNEEYLQLLMQRLLPQNSNVNEVIEKEKEDFYNYMEHLKLLKVKDKFNIGKKEEEINKESLYSYKTDSNKNIMDKKEQNDDNKKDKNKKEKKRKRKSCLLFIYDSLWNICLRNHMEPYSAQKKIWAGKNGVFKKEFQDNRIYKKNFNCFFGNFIFLYINYIILLFLI